VSTVSAPKLRHGFKAEADRTAVRLRRAVGLRDRDPLPARVLASHVGVPLLPMQRVPGLPESVGESLDDSGCHGLTLYDPDDGTPLHILYNAANSPERQEADITHELAHVLLKHAPNEVVRLAGVDLFRDFNAEQEEEAKWLGGCLQITREGLLWAVGRGMTTEEIAAHFTASVQMARFRRNMSGVDRQIARGRRW
jgi:hypothetical protein